MTTYLYTTVRIKKCTTNIALQCLTRHPRLVDINIPCTLFSSFKHKKKKRKKRTSS